MDFSGSEDRLEDIVIYAEDGSEDRLEDIVIYAEDTKQRIIPVYTEDETVIKTEHVQ